MKKNNTLTFLSRNSLCIAFNVLKLLIEIFLSFQVNICGVLATWKERRKQVILYSSCLILLLYKDWLSSIECSGTFSCWQMHDFAAIKKQVETNSNQQISGSQTFVIWTLNHKNGFEIPKSVQRSESHNRLPSLFLLVLKTLK